MKRDCGLPEKMDVMMMMMMMMTVIRIVRMTRWREGVEMLMTLEQNFL